MSSGYGAAYADCVEQKFVKRTCAKEFKAFIKEIDDEGNVDFDFVANQFNFEPVEEVPDPIVRAYRALCEAFKNKTGLALNLGFHDQHDDGDRYDDINGAYWWVDGVYQRTPAGEKYKDDIQRCSFVQYG